MASVKQRKGKGRAATTVEAYDEAGFVGTFARSPMYVLRKAAFESLPPAKVVKPVRYLRRRFEEALKVWDREVQAAIERGRQVAGGDEVCIKFPFFERNLWLSARAANGSPVAQALAR